MNVRVSAWLSMLAIVIFGSALFCGTLLAQSSHPNNLPASEKSAFFSAQNRWRLTPVDIVAQHDTVTPELRAKRNDSLESTLEFVAKLYTPQPPKGVPASQVGVGQEGGSYLADTPELSEITNSLWCTAKFVSFHVFAIDPGYRMIYTEMNFQVNQVVRQPQSASLTSSSALDAEVTGGRIKKPDGSVVTFLVSPERHWFQPGHTYLIHGSYKLDTQYISIHQAWDVSTGVLAPVTHLERYRATKGTSKLNGLSSSQALQYLNSVLPTE